VADNSPIIADGQRSRAKEIHAAMLAVEAKQADALIGNHITASDALDSDACKPIQLNLLESLYGKLFGI
jgi:hypothetical protein